LCTTRQDLYPTGLSTSSANKTVSTSVGLRGFLYHNPNARTQKTDFVKSGEYPAEPSYMKHRTEGDTETTISGDNRADWSEAFELVPSLQAAYVWHAGQGGLG